MTPDITNPRVFAILSIICIILGGMLGMMCSYLFYTVTHIRISSGEGVYLGEVAAKQIDPIWGIIFILIMAVTAFCIALTFRLVPGWVARYYETREIPPFMKWIHELIEYVENSLGEKE